VVAGFGWEFTLRGRALVISRISLAKDRSVRPQSQSEMREPNDATCHLSTLSRMSTVLTVSREFQLSIQDIRFGNGTLKGRRLSVRRDCIARQPR
jgi:hypothetical protein